MMKHGDEHPHGSSPLASKQALVRYDAVRWLQEAVQSGLPLRRALASASQRAWAGKCYSVPTLERWYYAYRSGGFAALELRARADKGHTRALSPEACEVLVRMRKEHPQINITTLVRELQARGVIEPGTVSLPTIYRYLEKRGLDPRSMKLTGQAPTQAPTRPFELAAANDLWMCDGMHGPRLARPGRCAMRTHLLALIDDCSRLCPHAQYYPAERLEFFLDTFRHSLQSRGIPQKLYTDNGRIFTSTHLRTICANLDIALIHHKPYQAWSKGKIERFFRTVQQDFEQRLRFEPARDLDELNHRFWQWLELEYHRRAHRGLEGQTPSERFAERSDALRILDPQTDLEGLFLARTQRRVRRDATISLEGRTFEVPVALRGRTVEVRYNPFGFGRVEIFLAETFMGRATACDRELNSRTFEKENYDEPQ